MFTTTPLWLIALVFAVAAPWLVRALVFFLDARARKRTQDLLARIDQDRAVT
jgi:hypothetical protein